MVTAVIILVSFLVGFATGFLCLFLAVGAIAIDPETTEDTEEGNDGR